MISLPDRRTTTVLATLGKPLVQKFLSPGGELDTWLVESGETRGFPSYKKLDLILW